MRITQNSPLRTLGLTAVLAVVALPAMAGGPLAICQPGQAYLWPNGGANITFNPDQGDLGPVPGPAAVALVDSAFQVWEDVSSATLTYAPGSSLPVDVDITNFGPFLNAVAPDGLSAVVFDDDGQIFDLLFGVGTGVLGFAGPEWATPSTCTIDEGLSFLNGPSFTNGTAALDVMVHEFGHWTNFAHTVINGQIYLGSVGGDNTGPTPFDTFGAAPSPFTDIVETMYPFYFGPGIGTATLEADDIAIASRMYPEPTYASTTGEISGQILFGSSRITGVNVIARNVADPFRDAVSAISSDFTDNTAQSDPNVGLYRITGLTPGADYGVYVDEILAGGFSTALSTPLPGPEELYNGAAESGDPNTDDPSVFTAVAAVAGSPNTGIDIIFNQPAEGDPLPVGDDGSVQLALPFDFCVHGESFGSVFVNANGSLTFGAGDGDFSESDQEFLDGPPRVAGLWDDLNPSAGGSVFFNQTGSSLTVTWEDVPEWLATGSNTFDITLYDNSSDCADSDSDSGSDDDSDSDSDRKGADIKITHGGLTAVDGLVGVSGGLATTSGAETESDLSAISNNGSKKIKLDKDAAVFENFSDGDNDLANGMLRFSKVGDAFEDKFENNNSLDKAKAIVAPFDTLDTKRRYSAIAPAAADIDFYRFAAEADQYVIAEVARGQIDSVLGLYFCPDDGDSDSDSDGVGECDPNTAILIAANDDSNGLLSRIEGTLPVTGTYGLAVTFCCDFDFDGVDAGQGAPLDGGRYVLDLQVLNGVPLPLGDDTSINLSGFGFSIPYDGASYSDIFVNSNGNITFGAGDPFGFSSSIPAFESGDPRVAPLWEDLDATGALVLAETNFATELKISFIDVPEFGGVGANNFSVTLFSNGDVQFDYGSITATTGVVGTAQGFGAPSTATDFSAAGGGFVSASSVEQFDSGNPYDLSNPDTLVFTP